MYNFGSAWPGSNFGSANSPYSDPLQSLPGLLLFWDRDSRQWALSPRGGAGGEEPDLPGRGAGSVKSLSPYYQPCPKFCPLPLCPHLENMEMGKRAYGGGRPCLRASSKHLKAVVTVLAQTGASTCDGMWAPFLSLQGFHSSFRKGSSEHCTQMEQKMYNGQ